MRRELADLALIIYGILVVIIAFPIVVVGSILYIAWPIMLVSLGIWLGGLMENAWIGGPIIVIGVVGGIAYYRSSFFEVHLNHSGHSDGSLGN